MSFNEAGSDWGSEDQGNYRHPETIGGIAYVDLEVKVFAALAKNIRTLPAIKRYCGLERSVDASDLFAGMELDRKIRKCDNGTISAYFLFEQMPKKFWLAGDGTVGAEFDETFVPSEPLKIGQTATVNFNGNKISRGKPGSGRIAIEITEETMEQVASELPNVEEIAKAVGYAKTNSLYLRFKKEPRLRDAYDRGRRKYAIKQRPDQFDADGEPISKPVEVIQKPRSEERTMSKDTTAATEQTNPKTKRTYRKRTAKAHDFDMEKIEQFAADGKTKTEAAKSLGINVKTFMNHFNPKRTKTSVKDAWERGLARRDPEAKPTQKPRATRDAAANPKKGKPVSQPASHADATHGEVNEISQIAVSETHAEETLTDDTQKLAHEMVHVEMTVEHAKELSDIADDISGTHEFDSFIPEAEMFPPFEGEKTGLRPPGMSEEEFEQVLKDLWKDMKLDMRVEKAFTLRDDGVVLTPLPKTFITFDSDEGSQLAVAFEGNIFNLSKRDRMILDLVSNLMQSYRSGELREVDRYEVHFKTKHEPEEPKTRWQRFKEVFA